MARTAKKSYIKAFSVILALTVLSAAELAGCSPDDVTKGLDTYASEDVSFITELADYKNITVEKDLTVTDVELGDRYAEDLSEITARCSFTGDPAIIDPYFERLASIYPEDKLTENGDFICFDYSGHIGDEPLTGGIASYRFTWLGSGNFIPGFEESIVGHKAGETFPIDVTFPSYYPQNTDLENKEVTFDITVHYIIPPVCEESVAILREFDEALYNETKDEEDGEYVEKYNDEESYKAYVKKSLKDKKEKDFNDALESLILEKLYNECKYSEVPADRIASFKKSVEDTAAMYGVSLDVYLFYAYGGIGAGEQYDELARFQVCARAIIAAIVQKEHMKISQKTFDENCAIIVENYGYDSVEQLISEAGKENICNSIFVSDVLELLKKNAHIETIE